MTLTETVDNIVYKTRNGLAVAVVLLALAGGTVGIRNLTYEGFKKARLTAGITTTTFIIIPGIFYSCDRLARRQPYTQNYQKEEQVA